jgi:hypothetical protein
LGITRIIFSTKKPAFEPVSDFANFLGVLKEKNTKN